MLEQKELDVLKNMMESVLEKSEESILSKVDERLEKSEESILSKVDERLEKSEESILSKVDERLEKSEESILSKVDERLANSENLLLEEMERTRSTLDTKIERVQKNLDELSQHYRITKLENDNMALLLKMIEGLTRRVEELERKTA